MQSQKDSNKIDTIVGKIVGHIETLPQYKNEITKEKDSIKIFVDKLSDTDLEYLSKFGGKELYIKYTLHSSSEQYAIGKNDSHLKFLSQEYDKFFRKVEIFNTILTVMLPGASEFPVISTIVAVGRAVMCGGVKVFKDEELSYICSACLSFVTSHLENLYKIMSFYATSGKPFPNAMGPTFTNCFKFLYFLICEIDFDGTTIFNFTTLSTGNSQAKDLGPNQFLFWHTLLSQFNFDTSKKSGVRFEYTDEFCVDTRDYNKRNLDFLDESTLCNNFNDIIMRRMERNVIDLIWLKRKDKFQLLKEKKYTKYSEFIQLLDKIYEIDRISKQVDSLTPNIIQRRINAARSMNNSVKTSMTNLVNSVSNSSSVSGKNKTTIPQNAGKKTITNIRNVKKMKNTRKNKSIQSGGGWFSGLLRLGTPEQKYREMLREYVIMTGNMTLILAEYNLDYNSIQDSKLTDQSNKISDQSNKISKMDIKSQILAMIDTQIANLKKNKPSSDGNQLDNQEINELNEMKKMINSSNDNEMLLNMLLKGVGESINSIQKTEKKLGFGQ
jgi:hypothetical protein